MSYKKAIASSIVIIEYIVNIFAFKSDFSTSFLNRFPLQVSHGNCTSMKTISTFMEPSPLQVSHRPPSTLKKKCLALASYF
jgi:hypothetical protein